VITEEREQRTLGLLDLAGFGRLSILLGKSVGSLAGIVQILLVQLPFALLGVTMGGISSHQVWGAFTQLGAYVAVVFGLSVLASSLGVRSGAAARLTSVLLAAWIVLPHFVSGLVSAWTGGTRLAWLQDLMLDLLAVEPYGALMAITTTGWSEPVVSPAVV